MKESMTDVAMTTRAVGFGAAGAGSPGAWVAVALTPLPAERHHPATDRTALALPAAISKT
jgi:hypothetical protein